MAKSKINKNRNLLLIVAIVIIVAIGALFYSNSGVINKQLVSQQGSNTTKIFQSSNIMNFSIVVPAEYETDEYLGSVTVKAGEDEEILIGRNGTNYDSLGDYISNSDSRRNLIVTEVENTVINGHEALSRIIEFPDQGHTQKSYYIYVNNIVYILSTSSQSLYNDLDQIAQSFKYTGE